MRNRFNEAGYWENIKSGKWTSAVLESRISAALTHEIVVITSVSYSYLDENGNEMARVHQYERPDGSIAASRLPDPKRMVQDGTLYRLTTKLANPSRAISHAHRPTNWLCRNIMAAEELKSDGLDGEQGEVVDEADFFLNEGVPVFDACQQAVVTGLGEGALADFFLGDEEATAGRLVGVLRLIGHERGMTLLDEGRDVNDEGGTHVGVEAGVDDLERAMWSNALPHPATRTCRRGPRRPESF